MNIRHIAVILLALALGLGAGYLFRHLSSQQAPVTEGNYSAVYASAGADVVLYSLSTCPYCKQARELLTANNVPFVERVIDQSADAKDEARELEIEGVPVIFVGRHRIQGYDQEAILDAVREGTGTGKGA